jgi:HEAT repeat protein
LIRVLAELGDVRAPAVIEPFLDDRALCTTAAEAFGQLPPELALPPLERRLSSADYRYGRRLLIELARRASWWEGPAGQSLLKLAAASSNPATRHAARDLLERF